MDISFGLALRQGLMKLARKGRNGSSGKQKERREELLFAVPMPVEPRGLAQKARLPPQK